MNRNDFLLPPVARLSFFLSRTLLSWSKSRLLKLYQQTKAGQLYLEPYSKNYITIHNIRLYLEVKINHNSKEHISTLSN